jgi:hypothetical protein
MDVEQLADEYASKSDEELLRLALNPEELTPEANVVLSGELSKRGIASRERLDLTRQQEQERKAEEDRDTGSLFFFHPYGIGRYHFGKADRSYDVHSGIERFKTTVFVVLFWIPLIPTGTFLVERKRGFFSGRVRVLERLPFDWEQVLKVWIVVASAIFAVILAFRLLRYVR